MSTQKPDLSPFCLRARSLLGRGLAEDALGLYGDVLKIDPENAMAYADRGTALAMLKKFDQALDDLERALALGYVDATIYATLGTVYLEQRQFKTSLDYFSKAIELNPSYPLTYYNRSNALHALGQNREALTDLERCLALNPESDVKKLIDRRMDFLRQTIQTRGS